MKGPYFERYKEMKEQQIRLFDGRMLSYNEYGPPTGKPVLYFHGTPSSRLEPLLLDVYGKDLNSLLVTTNIRLIAVDRPGMGLSSFDPKRSFLSFAADVHYLCQQLNIHKTEVMCWSGGGTYALAMAYAYPQLIKAVYIICGFTKLFDKEVMRLMGMNKWYFILAKNAPLVLKSGMNILRHKAINRPVPQKITGLPYVDYALLKDVSKLSAVAELTMKEAARNGAKGAVSEAAYYYKHPGFDIKAIQQPIHYWWGTLDMSVVHAHAEEIESKAPNAIMHYREHEGHFSLYINFFEEVLQQITRSD